MKKNKLIFIILLGVVIVLLGAANVFLYVEGKQTVKHVDVKKNVDAEVETEEDTEDEKLEVISGSMEDFIVSYDTDLDILESDTSEEDAEADTSETETSEEDAEGDTLETDTSEEDAESDTSETETSETDTPQKVKKAEYIFPNSDSAYLKKKDLKGMSAKKLRLARNELYARHGYIFNDKALAKYFKSKSWYKPKVKSTKFSDKKYFNKYEKANRNLIKKMESKK